MKATKIAGIVSIVAGIVMIVAGALTWGTVSSQLAAENITVPGDSTFMGGAYAGKTVSGPVTAYAQAEIINVHSLAGADGKTYAELGALAREAKEAGDTEAAEAYTAQRTTAMNGSFLRASLFTSVVSYGVAALVIGLGFLFAVIGWALTTIRTVEGRPVTE